MTDRRVTETFRLPKTITIPIPWEPPEVTGALAIRNCEPVPSQILEFKVFDRTERYRIAGWEPAVTGDAWACTLERIDNDPG